MERPVGLWWHNYVVTRTLRRLVLRPIARFKILEVTATGKEYLPEKGGNIVAGNHPHPWDAPFMYGTLDRNTIFLAKAELWRWHNPILRFMMSSTGQISVDRGNRDSGAKAQKNALRVLNFGKNRRRNPRDKGGTIVIFPEGGCTPPDGTLRKFKGGVYRMALASGAPVIPFGSNGTANIGLARAWHMFRKEQRQHVTVNFGEPMYAAGYENEEAFLAELRVRIESLRTQPWSARQATA